MTHTENGHEAEFDPHRRAAEQAFRAGQRAQQERREAREAQRSAADSLDKSADSHQRTAKAYEKAAEYGDRHRDGFLEAAARHRGFAQQDRCMAQQLRQMAEGDSTGNPARPSNAVGCLG